MNATAPSAFGSLANIFFEPRNTLSGLRERPGLVWLPFLLLLGAFAAFQAWYCLRVDASWFADITLAPDAAKYTADQLRDAHARFTTGSMLFFGVGVNGVGLALWFLLQGLYFFLVAKLGGYKVQGFGNWFNFICWTNLPALLGFAASAVYMLTTDSRQINPMDLDVTSLNTLLFHVQYAHNGFFIASSLRLTVIWSWILMVIGMSAWSGKDLKRSALVVLAPYAVLYAVFILFALR